MAVTPRNRRPPRDGRVRVPQAPTPWTRRELGEPPLMILLAGLLAMVAVVWTTPALRDVVDLVWLKIQLVLGLG